MNMRINQTGYDVLTVCVNNIVGCISCVNSQKTAIGDSESAFDDPGVIDIDNFSIFDDCVGWFATGSLIDELF